MSLMKLFNFKYLKENIKKSRGLLAFFFGVIPLINIIVLITIISNDKINIMNFYSLSSITILGMFILPFVLAVSLFGFLFQKKSVDFVMSKPLSRKSIYVTNILGGMSIIIIFILLNALIFSFFGVLFHKLIIPGALILDYTICFIISYIFIFIVSSLARTVAGNILTSLVLVLIIICLFPFISLSKTYFNYNRNFNYLKCSDCQITSYSCGGNETCTNKLREQSYKLVYHELPSQNLSTPAVIAMGLNSNLSNNISFIRTIILSIAYIFIGYFTFKNRKMENNEISFKSEFAHYFVKSITYIPIMFIAYFLIESSDFIGILISLAAILIYSVVYDLLTRKAIYKFLKSSLLTIGCFIFLLAIYNFYDYYARNNTTTIDINKIESLTLDNEIEIKNKELIKEILVSSFGYNNSISTSGTFKVKNKNYSTSVIYINENLKDKIATYSKSILEEKIKTFDYDNIVSINYNNIYGENYAVTPKLIKLIKETMKQATSNDIYKSKNSILIYNYRNYNYESIQVPITINEELNKYIMNYNNEKFLKLIEEQEHLSIYLNSYYNSIFSPEDIYLSEYVLSKNINNLIKYIKNNNTKITSNYNTYLMVYGKTDMRLLIGDQASFQKEFEKYKELLKDDPEFIRMKESYNRSMTNEY